MQSLNRFLGPISIAHAEDWLGNSGHGGIESFQPLTSQVAKAVRNSIAMVVILQADLMAFDLLTLLLSPNRFVARADRSLAA